MPYALQDLFVQQQLDRNCNALWRTIMRDGVMGSGIIWLRSRVRACDFGIFPENKKKLAHIHKCLLLVDIFRNINFHGAHQ